MIRTIHSFVPGALVRELRWVSGAVQGVGPGRAAEQTKVPPGADIRAGERGEGCSDANKSSTQAGAGEVIAIENNKTGGGLGVLAGGNVKYSDSRGRDEQAPWVSGGERLPCRTARAKVISEGARGGMRQDGWALPLPAAGLREGLSQRKVELWPKNLLSGSALDPGSIPGTVSLQAEGRARGCSWVADLSGCRWIPTVHEDFRNIRRAWVGEIAVLWRMPMGSGEWG